MQWRVRRPAPSAILHRQECALGDGQSLQHTLAFGKHSLSGCRPTDRYWRRADMRTDDGCLIVAFRCCWQLRAWWRLWKRRPNARKSFGFPSFWMVIRTSNVIRAIAVMQTTGDKIRWRVFTCLFFMTDITYHCHSSDSRNYAWLYKQPTLLASLEACLVTCIGGGCMCTAKYIYILAT